MEEYATMNPALRMRALGNKGHVQISPTQFDSSRLEKGKEREYVLGRRQQVIPEEVNLYPVYKFEMESLVI